MSKTDRRAIQAPIPEDSCPTKAFTGPYQLDARRCISYLTIEHDGPIAEELRPMMGNRIYGCDDCLDACPWNKFAHQSREARFQSRDILVDAKLADLVQLDDASFRAAFSKSPIKRTGRDKFVRKHIKKRRIGKEEIRLFEYHVGFVIFYLDFLFGQPSTIPR